jgi:hypothetical protein
LAPVSLKGKPFYEQSLPHDFQTKIHSQILHNPSSDKRRITCNNSKKNKNHENLLEQGWTTFGL